jgi:hypothetical protein
MIHNCPLCREHWQDIRYGKNQRVFNICKEGIRCTVCKTVTRITTEEHKKLTSKKGPVNK